MAVSLILTEQIIKLFIILLLGFLLVKSDTSLYDH